MEQKKGIISLILLAFGFGAIAIIVRYLGTSFSLFQQIYLTLGIAFICSLFLFKNNWTIKKIKNISWKDWIIMILRVLIGYLIGTSMYRESILLTKVSNVAFIQSIPFAAIFGWILLKEKFSWKKMGLILIGYLGVIFIAVKDYSSLFSLGTGEFFALISSAFFSLSYISRKWMTNTLTDKEIAQLLLFLGTIVLMIASLISGDRLPITQWNWILLIALFLSGVFNAINIFLINYGFRNVSAVMASNILTLESIFALILAFIFFKELPNVKELIGGLLIIGSVIQMNRLSTK